MEPHKPPFPKWYNPNSCCDYYCGAQGHSIENWLPLKYKAQSLIKASWLDFNRNNRPSVTANLLPNHIGPTINAIMEDSGVKIKTKVDEIESSMDKVYKVMVNIRAIPEKKDFDGKCCFCREASIDHIIGKCGEFKNLLQMMIN